ncbi:MULTISPECIES: family 16 glycosylhydrolase [unclassified Streptomyces]|uniref:family 16 glycosylhydrolase n=1 Tax=unclassified Streptomyces TaxID=2593676 RepID=UPI000B82EECE|nr:MULTISPECIES: family 16 glycosylhydrolase [unclassified Streptomyces]MDX2730273.1 family 16 glycosylhydrolase [Streptomyces sp. PA03-2a]MDX3768959.1 family 16 glycosylhydrolase [Streptomyces sp. AK08-01B]MDX3815637.1 family 16 glycosylhydrolase [Streptomyces sp. AK08-01A]
MSLIQGGLSAHPCDVHRCRRRRAAGHHTAVHAARGRRARCRLRRPQYPRGCPPQRRIFARHARLQRRVHGHGYGADHKASSANINAPGLHCGCHTYAVEWKPTQMIFRYDGAVVRTVNDANLISQVPMFPVISHEAAEWADGSIYDALLDYRSNMYVDYIRVWQ